MLSLNIVTESKWDHLCAESVLLDESLKKEGNCTKDFLWQARERIPTSTVRNKQIEKTGHLLHWLLGHLTPIYPCPINLRFPGVQRKTPQPWNKCTQLREKGEAVFLLTCFQCTATILGAWKTMTLQEKLSPASKANDLMCYFSSIQASWEKQKRVHGHTEVGMCKNHGPGEVTT